MDDKKSRTLLALAILAFTLPLAGWAQPAPRIFFSDLESGPNTGGENNKGAFVTIYGRGFGDSRGSSTVTIGGGAAESYPLWSNTKIAFQPGKAAQSGEIVVHVEGSQSNGVPFTVRPGRIFFVAPSGRDSAGGGFSSPWQTIVKAKNSIGAGDIAYVMNGVSQAGVDDYNASLAIASAGSEGRPRALVAYPGAKPVIGSPSGPEFGVRTPTISGGPFSYWVLAGFVIRGANEALDLARLSHWRVVGNDISCPHGDGPAACFEAAAASYLRVLGNTIHDSGRPGASKLYHSLYFTTDSNHIEAGWNVIANNHSCRGIQFHSSRDGAGSGFNQYDLSVHDNLIHGQVCDGINFATIDPSKGPVLAWNNIIYGVGLGPDPPDGGSNYACISSPGITNSGSPGSGTAEWFNNTLFDCGPRGGVDAGAFHAGAGSPAVRLRNNLVQLKTGENYIEPSSSKALISGSNNLWFGAGGAPANLGAKNSDPRFANISSFDFHPQPGSPAIDAGVNTGIPTDFDGIPRPQGGAFDIGAFERPASAPPGAPAPRQSSLSIERSPAKRDE
ncbi:MAG: IPT/TIG domain-containing protein [Acidobacteriia bacterium]|nr:IPT/TIG domain-containing protein [Terriglobia bacterium]